MSFQAPVISNAFRISREILDVIPRVPPASGKMASMKECAVSTGRNKGLAVSS
jgi:hypothetical protein